MTAFWQNLIQQSRQDTATTFDKGSLQIIPLDQLAVLEVSGDDASTFLQNLLTNDITTLAVGAGQYSGLCNPKGRLIAYFLVIRRHSTSFQLILPLSVCEAIQKRLAMYVLRSKVTITNCSQDVACIGFYPSNRNEHAGLGFNETLLTGHESRDCFAIRLPSDSARWLVLIQTADLEKFAGDLPNYHLCQADYWELDDIASGIAKVTTETQEKFTPQQVNLDLNNSVSFSKGCYPGQEVVARLHYLGKPSRRLYKTVCQSDSTATIGSEILTEDKTVAGHIVNIQKNPSGMACLISLKLSELNNQLLTEDGVKLHKLMAAHSEN